MELLINACPHCGSFPKPIPAPQMFIYCEECGLSGPSSRKLQRDEGQTEAIRLWNSLPRREETK